MQETKPRVLMVTPTPPFPPNNGGVLRIYSLVSHLKDRFDFSLLTFASGEEKKYNHAIALLALESLFDEVMSVPAESIIPDRKAAPELPRIALEWFSPAMAGKIWELTSSGEYDIIHFEFLQMAFYGRYARGAVKFYTEHDLSHISLFNSYFREWTGLRRIKEIPEWRRVVKYHRDVCNEFDRVIVLTKEDREDLVKIMPADKTSLVKTGSDLSRFPFVARDPSRMDPGIIYVGHYLHYPNEDAALWLANDIFPRIAKEWPQARLRLVGSDPTAKIQALASDRITVTGSVPEIHPYLAAGGIFAAPVRLGFGIKGKVIEAFSSGIPVVATKIVAKGIPEARDGEHLLVADNPRDFADAILKLKNDRELYLKLSKNARELAERHYSWSMLSDGLARAYMDELDKKK